jgi:acetyl esterase/lipase
VSYGSIVKLETPQPSSVITYGPAPQQFIEGWLPESEAPLTDIVFIHGGCWLSAYDIAHSRPLTGALRDAGFRVWSIEYRRAGDENGGWPNSLHDINDAIAQLKEQKKINPENTLLMGHSAGGHLALLGAQKDQSISGVIGLAAIADISAYAKGGNSCQSATKQFMHGMPSEKPHDYAIANPKSNPMPENTWLIYSEQDSIVPATQIDGLSNVETIKVPEAGHFDFIHPDATAFAMIIDTVNAAKEASKQ